MPIYNEDTERVYLGLRQTWLSVQKAGLAPYCDLYVLSDSTEEEIQRKEEEVYRRLLKEFAEHREAEEALVPIGLKVGRASPSAPPPRPTHPAGAPGEARPTFHSDSLISTRFFLVRRKERRKYKAGNIANFLVHYGTEYDFMLVLDADSVMLGETIKRLILRMQQSPRGAILQTVVLPIRASTPFARAAQFACSRTVPLFATGQNWFYGSESVYWGHNALIRVAPFMTYCNLPVMPGKPPMGGEIMSQDIVEAALLGRAGWEIDWQLDCGGSFDEMPANLLTYGRRDRRWCQGNCQHFWLIFGDGIKWGHRMYFANGIFAYAGGPLLLLLTFLGFVQGLRGRVYKFEPLMIGSFLLFFLMMLLLPKVLGFFRRVTADDGYEERAKSVPSLKSAVKKELLSTLLEVVISSLYSPALFYLHTRFVLEILLGRVVPWKAQSRNPNEMLAWSTAARVFWLPTILGIVWLVPAIRGTPGFVPYLLPILSGWILSIPVAVWTSSPAMGAWLTRHGLLADCLSDEERETLGPLHQPAPVGLEFNGRQNTFPETGASHSVHHLDVER